MDRAKVAPSSCHLAPSHGRLYPSVCSLVVHTDWGIGIYGSGHPCCEVCFSGAVCPWLFLVLLPFEILCLDQGMISSLCLRLKFRGPLSLPVLNPE